MATYNPSKFDIAEYLEDGDSADILTAIGHIAKAQGMSKIAAETGLSRTSLYKALSKGAKPQFETVLKVLRAIGSNLQVKTT